MANVVALRPEPVDDRLNTYCIQFETAEEATRDARQKAERDRDYYDEKQWTADEIATLEKRGQPVITNNRIKRKVNSLMGLEKQARKDPKAFPRNPDDEQAAKAATDAIRYVCDNSHWDDKRSQCAKELAIEGTCAVMVGAVKAKGGFDPDIRRVAWDRFYYDPASAEFDFADANFKGVVVWMDLADAKRKYPRAADILEATWANARSVDTFDDKPSNSLWADYKRKRVRLCEHYCKDGEWTFSIFTKAGFVEEPRPSPYLDEAGEPECPLHAVSLYVDRDNNRYGEVRTMIGPQDAINKHESKALHWINENQVRVSPAMSMSPEKARKEMARADGVFVGERDDVERLGNADRIAGSMQMAQLAKDEIDSQSVNAALQGKQRQDLSGKAIMAQQQGGMMEAASYLDCIRVLSVAVYRSVWARVRQYWKGERWVRVSGDENNLRFVGLNKPVTALQQLQQQMTQAGITRENLDSAPPEILKQLQAMADNPQMASQTVAIENNVAELDVDIVIDEGIDTPTVQAEQFETLAQMMPALGPVGQSPQMFKMLIKASSLRDKQELIEIIEPKDGQAPPSPEEMMAQQAQALQQQAQMEGQIEIEKAKIKAMADIEIAKIKAEADAVIKQQTADMDAQIQHQQMLVDAEIAQAKAEADAMMAEKKAMLDFEVKSRVADATGETARAQTEADKEAAHEQEHQAMAEQMAAIMAELQRPRVKVPIRDEQGLIIRVEEV